MTEKNKPGIGRFEGNKYQLWFAVKLILSWILELAKNTESESPWLRLEIGVQKYGIFDDILMFKDSTYYFFQAKSTSNILGDSFDEENLIDDSDEISIKKMYKSYNLIKQQLNHSNFELLIISNKPSANKLRRILMKNDGHLENSFIMGTCTLNEKKELRKDLIAKLDAPEDFEDFLKKLIFNYCESPENEIINHPIFPKDFINHIYNLVKKNAIKESKSDESKIKFEDIITIYDMDKFRAKTPIKIVIYSKMNLQNSSDYEESIDLTEDTNLNLNNINWGIIWDKIKNLKEKLDLRYEKKNLYIEIKAHLTIGFIFGFLFRKTTGYQLIVNQLGEFWELVDQSSKLLFKKLKKDLDIKIKKSLKKNTSLIVRLNFTGKNVQIPSDRFISSHNIHPKVAIDIKFKRSIKKEEVTNIISIILDLIQKNLKFDIQEIHIFNSIPIGLAILLGYHFNSLPPIYLYEFDNINNKYVQSIILK